MRLKITEDKNRIEAEFGLSGSEQQYYAYFKLALEKLQKYLNNAQKIQGIVHDKLDKEGVFSVTDIEPSELPEMKKPDIQVKI